VEAGHWDGSGRGLDRIGPGRVHAVGCGEMPTQSATQTEPGVWYQCQRCTNCCRWSGVVAVDDAEIAAIARFLEMSEWDFVQQYTRLRANRQGLALTEMPDGACVFLKGKDCAIQPVKPRQCAGFPNTWNFPGWREVCEAIPVRV